MRNENAHLFRILDEVSKDASLTQRGLSRRIGVALGLTNLYLKRLAKKGLIKIVNVKANRLRYELTPSGIAQKTAMALQYVQDSYVFYREARKSLTSVFDRMRQGGVRTVVLYGTGDLAEIALLSLQEARLEVVGVVSPGYSGEAWCGKPVRQPELVASLSYDRIVVVTPDREQAVKVLESAGVDKDRVDWV